MGAFSASPTVHSSVLAVVPNADSESEANPHRRYSELERYLGKRLVSLVAQKSVTLAAVDLL
jgi:hypothetical protein